MELRKHGEAYEKAHRKAQPSWKRTRKTTLKLQMQKIPAYIGYSNYS